MVSRAFVGTPILSLAIVSIAMGSLACSSTAFMPPVVLSRPRISSFWNWLRLQRILVRVQGVNGQA